MTQHIWHSSPPPHVGWWCTNKQGRFSRWRWWDGYKWSLFASPSEPVALVVRLARQEAHRQDQQWCDYWPENARVPRIDPRRTEGAVLK